MADYEAYLSSGHEERTLVVIFLRGGADGLTMVAPVGDDGYYRARPQIGVRAKDAVALDGVFALHTRLAPLAPLYREGELAIVHQAGSEDTTRSHFEAQDFMEQGGHGGGGWLGRHLRLAEGTASGPLAAVAMGKTQPESLRGAPNAVVMESVDAFSFGEGHRSFVDALAGLYAKEDDLLGRTGGAMVKALDKLERLRTTPYRPHHGAQYLDDTFNGRLMQAARLIKADLNVRAVAIDLDGWDAHFAMATLMDPLMHTLASGLSAFRQDLGEAMRRTSVVVMTEFGRRVYENASFGTDHGRGGVMLLLGGGIEGGKVHAEWKGLETGWLDGPGDLPVVHDYRDVVAPLLAWHTPQFDGTRVFPGYALKQAARETDSPAE